MAWVMPPSTTPKPGEIHGVPHETRDEQESFRILNALNSWFNRVREALGRHEYTEGRSYIAVKEPFLSEWKMLDLRGSDVRHNDPRYFNQYVWLDPTVTNVFLRVTAQQLPGHNSPHMLTPALDKASTEWFPPKERYPTEHRNTQIC